jgi:histidinol dehydrogenase
VSLCRIIDSREEDPFAFLARRGQGDQSELRDVVSGIIESVRTRGDEALLESARKFDSPDVVSIAVSDAEIQKASLPQEQEEAIAFSIRNVTRFHELQKEYLLGRGLEWRETLPHGGFLGQQVRALSKVGVYVPGGKASYPSSVIMNAIPAIVAGVPEVFVASPGGGGGSLSPAVMFALKSCGPALKSAFRTGGAAAIAAFAFGTESVPKVDKVVGPGNKYVNEAKRQLWGKVGLDLYAGPSEVCVLADEEANATYCAADLITQVEHSEDNVGFVVCLSHAKAGEILADAESQLGREPRAEIVRAALRDYGAVFIAKDMDEALEIVNAIAPEHLSVAVSDPEKYLDRLRNAGCLLLGEYTPESAGDFVLGPSHTLPTSTASRFSSPVNVMDFVKFQSVSMLTRADLEDYRRAIEVFGEMEGFSAHAFGATVRVETEG